MSEFVATGSICFDDVVNGNGLGVHSSSVSFCFLGDPENAKIEFLFRE